MIQPLGLIAGLAGNVQSQFTEGACIHAGKNNAGVRLAALQLVQLAHCHLGGGVGGGGYGEVDKHLVHMKPWIMVAKMVYLKVLYWLYYDGRYKVHILLYAPKLFKGVQQCCGGRPKELAGLAGDYLAAWQLYCGGGLFRPFKSGVYHRPVFRGGDIQLIHQQAYLFRGAAVAHALAGGTHGGVIAADYLLTGGLAADLIIGYAASYHIHAHVSWGFIGGFPIYALEYGVQHREYLHIPVVVHRGDPVCVQMEGVYHVNVIKVGCGGLIGNVYGVLQGKVPYWEGLKLGVARPYAPLMLMIELGQAGGHLAAAGAGGGYYHQRTLGFNVLVAPKAILAYYKLNVCGVANYGVVTVYPYAQLLKAALEGVRRVLPLILGKHHATNIEADAAAGVDLIRYIVAAGDRIGPIEESLMKKFGDIGVPVVLLVNKTDISTAKEIGDTILRFSEKYNFAAVIPISAKNGKNTDIIFEEIDKYAIEGEWIFPDDMITDQPERQIAAEFIREKLLRLLSDEIPHGIAVVIEDWKETSKLLSIRAEIFCERASHKPIIIGKGGATLKRVGEMARQDLEAFFGIKVFLDLWVKVKENWRASEMAVSNMGFKREDF